MADNTVTATPGTGITFASDQIGGIEYPRAKVVWGADGTATDTSAAAPLPVVQTGTLNVGTVTTVTTVSAVTAISNALPAGTNNIGDVDVLTVPADPFGVNADAASASGSISAKLRQIATTGIPVTGTVTVGSHAVTNTGTFVMQENGAALTALQLIDDAVFAEDAAAQAADKGVAILAVRRDADTTLVGADNDYANLQVNAAGSLKVAITAGAGSGGTALADEAAFTMASTSVNPIGAVYNSTPDTLTTGKAGALQMTAARGLHGHVVDSAGVEILGTKADAKSTATDTTAVSAVSIWKQISASVQALVTGAVPLGNTTAANSLPMTIASNDAITGGVTETSPATDTASSGLNGRLQRIAQRITSLITALGTPFQAGASIGNTTFASTQSGTWTVQPGNTANTTAWKVDGSAVTQPVSATQLTALISPGLSASATFTPAAASHVANDANGTVGTFALAAISAGRVMITGAMLEIDGATAEATAWRLYLYNATPTSAFADDAAWSYPDTDRSQFLGFIDLGTAIDYGANQWIEQNGINKQIKLASTGIYGYLVNLTTLTPANVAHIVTIHAVQL